MIDEIDKMGSDWRGDPSSAMLEVLDPAQNSSFRDHYLDLPFDLSKVLFICTANQLETIPPPLLDRMEIIRLSGYTEDEKLGIARRYLVPKQLEAHGLDAENVNVRGQGAAAPRREYTREAGVRNLDREIAALCRKAAARDRRGQAEDRPRSTRRASAPGSGGAASATRSRKRTSDPGVATGLAVTPVGGDILFIEATADARARAGSSSPASSATSCASPRRPRSPGCAGTRRTLGLEADWFADRDVHIHVPAGAVPKDGPSAGIAMATALVLARDGRPVSEDVAMTGEITLTGQVLPIGGVQGEGARGSARRASARSSCRRRTRPISTICPATCASTMTFVLADTSTTCWTQRSRVRTWSSFPRAARG